MSSGYDRSRHYVHDPALRLPLGVLALLHDKCTPIHGVDDNIAALEVRVVAPCSGEGDISSSREIIVLRVDIEVGNLLDALASGVIRDGADIQDVVTQGVVALVGKAINDELVVVDTRPGAGVLAGQLGILQRADVPNV